MKRIVSTFFFVIFALSTAHAQLIEGLLYGIGGNFLSKQLFPGKKEEFGTGKIVFNVYDVRDGRRTFVNCWDPSTGTAQAWNNGTELVPVIGINESGTPGEIQWALSTENGPMVKQQHNQVKGGKPDKNGGYKDNGGYKFEPYSLRMAELPWGVIFVHASWGRGKSATVQLMHIDVGHAYQLIDNDEGLRREFAGSGGGTFPQLPVSTVIIDGKPHYFMSDQEIEDYFKQGASKQPALPPRSGGDGEGGQRVGRTNDTSQKRPEPKAQPWNGQWRLGYYRNVLTEDLRQQTSTKGPRCFDQWSADLPMGDKLAILITSSQPFGMARVDQDGNVLATKTAALNSRTGLYEVFIGFTLDDGCPKGAIVVSDAERRTSVLEIVRTDKEEKV